MKTVERNVRGPDAKRGNFHGRRKKFRGIRYGERSRSLCSQLSFFSFPCKVLLLKNHHFKKKLAAEDMRD